MKSPLTILAILFVAACGTLSVDVSTIVECEPEFSHQIKIVATGMIWEEIEEPLDADKLRVFG